MNTAIKSGGRLKRVLAAFLCLILTIMLFPTEAQAFGSGQPASSYEGDIIVGSDGSAYYHPAPWSAIIYNHSTGAISDFKTYSGGQAYRFFCLTSAGGESRWAYCIEGGVGFEASTGAYTPGDNYFNVLPRDAQYGIMLATLYGWKPGASAPSGTSAADFYMATQVIVWEYQQQLRVNPHNRQSNGYYSGDQYYSIIRGRPAETAYNWILNQMAAHSTIPSFCRSSLSSAQTIELKWDTTRKLYELTLVDTNNTGIDLQVLSGSGVTITRSGNRYTFTSTKMIMDPISFQFRKNIPISENMLVWGRPGKQTLMTGTSDPVTFFLKIKTETYGWAKIIKTSEDGIVEGITFTISGKNVLGQTENATVKTDASGTLTHKILPGTYTVTEHPIDRYVTPIPQTVVVESGQTSSVSFHNILKKFRVMVYKRDVENGDPQGDAKLGGAVYGIYKGEQLMDTYTTDVNGEFTTKYYICDTNWTLREISPSEGYLLDPTVYPIAADPKLYTFELNTTEVHAKEQVIKGDIRLIKHTDEWDPNIPEEERDESANAGMIEAPEVGAQFQIYLKRAGSYEAANEWERDMLTTNEFGQAQSKLLPYGYYVVHQISGIEGKNFIPDFTVYIASQGKTYQYILNNDTIMGRVKIEKRDAETGEIIPLEGVGFKVRDLSTGEFISQTVWYPNPIVIDEFYTSSEGWLMLPEELPYGQYEAIEIQTCYGYVLDGTPVLFSIDGSEAVVTVTKHNMPQKGKIIIHK